MDCEESGLETVDFGSYAATLTVSNTDDADANTAGNNTLKLMLRNTALPEDQIQAILAANKSETTRKNETSQTGKNETSRSNDDADNKNEMHDDEDKKPKLAKITPKKQMNPKGKTLTSNSYTITKRETRSLKWDAIKNTEDRRFPGSAKMNQDANAKITPKKPDDKEKDK